MNAEKGVTDVSDGLTQALVELKRDDVLAAVELRAQAGEDPIAILEALRSGMTEIGARFQSGDYFLAELMLSAEAFKESMAILAPYLATVRAEKPLATIVLATLRGDVHDLGKNILAELLRAHGFEVIDLGVDVEAAVFVDKVKEVKPQFVGMSALLTSTYWSILKASQLFEEAGIRDDFKLLVGGGCTTPLVKEKCGADLQTLDAMEGVRYCLSQMGRN